MNFTEVKPGIIIDESGAVRRILESCPCCGGAELLSHTKYDDKCVDCGNLYNKYAVRRSARQRGKLGKKSLEAHLIVVNELKSRRDAGYSVPASIDSEASATNAAIVELTRLEEIAKANRPRVTYTAVRCNYCGSMLSAPEGSCTLHRCTECEVVYARYKAMYKIISLLNINECNEFAKIIEQYICLHNKGFITPQYSRAIDALQKRIVDLGGERYKFYRKKEV